MSHGAPMIAREEGEKAMPISVQIFSIRERILLRQFLEFFVTGHSAPFS
jgi:hypothetical protein